MDPCMSNIVGVRTPVTPAALTPMITAQFGCEDLLGQAV